MDNGNGAGPRAVHSGVVGVAMAVAATVANTFHVNPVLVAPLVAAVSHIGGLLIARWLKPARVRVPGNVATLLVEAERVKRQLHHLSNQAGALLAEAEWLASEQRGRTLREGAPGNARTS